MKNSLASFLSKLNNLRYKLFRNEVEIESYPMYTPGFYRKPEKGDTFLVFDINCNQDNLIGLPINKDVNNVDGVKVYSKGSSITLLNTGEVIIDATDVTINSNLEINGTIKANDITLGSISFNNHFHNLGSDQTTTPKGSSKK